MSERLAHWKRHSVDERPRKRTRRVVESNEASVCAHVFVRSFEKISPRHMSVYVDVESDAYLEIVRIASSPFLRISSASTGTSSSETSVGKEIAVYDIVQDVCLLKLFSVASSSPFRVEIVLREKSETFAIMLTDVDSSRKLSEFVAALKYYKNVYEEVVVPSCHRFFVPTASSSTTNSVFSSTYAVFSKQRDAFAFLDETSHTSINLRVFSLETNRSSRKFIVTTESACFQRILSLPANQRHYYEIIRENFPCRLFFDLEFEKSANPGLSGDKLTHDLIEFLIKHLKRRFKLEIDETNVLELGSSSTIKFSRHLVVHLPNDAMFRNTSHAGSFVSDFLACHETMFWVRSSRDDHTVRFVDESVYSRNRAFRMFLCSKRGKDALLLTTGTNRFKTDDSTWKGERELFRNALVIPSKIWNQRLRDCECDTSTWCKKNVGAFTILFSASTTGTNENQKNNNTKTLQRRERKDLAPQEISISSIPEALEFVNSLLKSWGKNSRSSYVRLVTAQQARDPLYPVTMSGVPTILTFEIIGNRYCANIGRQHRSNHISFVLCVHRGVWYQRCHDFDCRHFRSRETEIPFDVVESTLVRLMSLNE